MTPQLLERTTFNAPFEGIEVRDSGEGPDIFTVKGHAAVFNRQSLDLGGFTEKIARGAFSDVLNRSPDVHLVWDHDTRLTLARTRNGTLTLDQDKYGLPIWARIAPTSYAKDLRVLIERGDIDQMSFAFAVGEDSWLIENEGQDDERVLRTVTKVGELYDVTICAQGAYPMTDISVARSLVNNAISDGRLPEEARAIAGVARDEGSSKDAAPTTVDVANRKKLMVLKMRIAASKYPL